MARTVGDWMVTALEQAPYEVSAPVARRLPVRLTAQEKRILLGGAWSEFANTVCAAG
ncbi:hypothetical protein GCM10018962_42640 [Dactylosporangium matsuzakiense]|uniref:Uncharacterized protein n=1 Tax=Dactylosporangium matsuzakiense TaxID=53360 RepID=A0A9W6KFI1_9ACTN|nr:hypothetical protein GCM10017581_016570 [Dactylosporangium matsuzakiense]